MQTLNGNSKLLRIFVGEIDKYNHTPLYEAILYKAKETGMTGATVTRGIMSFGASNVLHTSKLLDISEDLPIIIELIDTADKIQEFTKIAGELLDAAGRGGIITVEDVTVIHYTAKK